MFDIFHTVEMAVEVYVTVFDVEVQGMFVGDVADARLRSDLYLLLGADIAGDIFVLRNI